jgi:hypothetical protein
LVLSRPECTGVCVCVCVCVRVGPTDCAHYIPCLFRLLSKLLRTPLLRTPLLRTTLLRTTLLRTTLLRTTCLFLSARAPKACWLLGSRRCCHCGRTSAHTNGTNLSFYHCGCHARVSLPLLSA